MKFSARILILLTTMKCKIQNTGKTQIPSLIRYTAGSASDVLV